MSSQLPRNMAGLLGVLLTVSLAPAAQSSMITQSKLPATTKPAAQAPWIPQVPLPEPFTWDGLLRYAFLCEKETWGRMDKTDHLSPWKTDRPASPDGPPYWHHLATMQSTTRTLVQMEELLQRLAGKGVNVEAENRELAALREKQNAVSTAGKTDPAAEEALYLEARQAKRRLLFRDPDLAALGKILFVKRHPYHASHNYSDVLDSQFKAGGGICTLEIPFLNGRLTPEEAKLTTLFDGSGGIARDPMADFAARKIYFAYRPDKSPVKEWKRPYWHLMVMNADGSGLRQLSDGPFHDYYPCPLPDGSVSFISTRCRARFLCWRPQSFVLFRMDADGENIRPLSYANLSEWTPTVMRNGSILWTRSEYIDKGSDFGHTLWTIRPDGTAPALVYGNNTTNCYFNAREVPGSREILCTLTSHGGDHNGPIGLIDPAKGLYEPKAITSITPDVKPQYHMAWLKGGCFRDPEPITRDYFLVSHAPADRFGLYVIDRYGNRELLYLDPAIGSMCPSLFREKPTPPVLDSPVKTIKGTDVGQFIVTDVYKGLDQQVERGRVKYIRVCQEVRATLDQMPDGEYRQDHPPFQDWYATPVARIKGPCGWPTYVAKAAMGIARVEADGSANFYAPAGKVLYFQALDENYNELQRMRSVIQLQPGEQRSCIGCHEDRKMAPPVRVTIASRRGAEKLREPSWGAVPFSFEKVVQPVLDARCARCHTENHKSHVNLKGTPDEWKVPASYRTLVCGGWVNHFNMSYGAGHFLAPPLSFGTLKSRIKPFLEGNHHGIKLTDDEMQRVKCWIDLNCPLWPDYIYRLERTVPKTVETLGRLP